MLTDQILRGDCLELLSQIQPESVHAIITDIPYGIGLDNWDVLHNNTNAAYGGQSPAQKKAGSVFNKRGKPINGWSESDRKIPVEYYQWCMKWLPHCFSALKPGGSVLIFAGRRFSHRCVVALEDSGFCLRDLLGWTRNAAAYRAQRLSIIYKNRGDQENADVWDGWRVGNLRPVFEPIIWAFKPYKTGGTIADNVIAHGVGAYNREAMERFWGHCDNVFHCSMEPSDKGLHPAQKPLRLMQALIELTTCPGQTVLDPFAGSGTTAVAARLAQRSFIAMESSSEFCDVIKKRLGDLGPLQ